MHDVRFKFGDEPIKSEQQFGVGKRRRMGPFVFAKKDRSPLKRAPQAMNGNPAPDLDRGAIGMRHRRDRHFVSALHKPFAQRNHVTLLAANDGRIELGKHKDAHQRFTTSGDDNHALR
jgi:hypothetical protein